MKFDVTMAMILGVVGIGAFATYKLVGTKSGGPQTTASASLNMQRGAHYQGRLVLQPLDVPPPSSTRQQLAQFFQIMGFTGVKVYMTPAELPSDWDELRTGGPDNRWFEGTYNGPTAELLRPRQVDRLSTKGVALISGMAG